MDVEKEQGGVESPGQDGVQVSGEQGGGVWDPRATVAAVCTSHLVCFHQDRTKIVVFLYVSSEVQMLLPQTVRLYFDNSSRCLQQ